MLSAFTKRFFVVVSRNAAHSSPWAFAIIPFFGLAAFAIAGFKAVAVFVLSVPVGMLISRTISAPPTIGRDALTGLATRHGVVTAIEHGLGRAVRYGQSTGVILIEIDRFKVLEERHDRGVIEALIIRSAERIKAAVREADVTGRLDGPTFAIALAPAKRLELESVIHLAGRLQRTLSEPVAVHGVNIYLTASVGFSLASRHPNPDSETLLQGATLALIEAQRSGPGGIRSYSDAMRTRVASRNILADEVSDAFDRGEIMAFFQPQISARTGDVTGFETLARWHHPERGLIPPVEFLPALAQAGLMDRLGEAMIREALTALRQWEDRGLSIPRVGVNFSNAELSDPRLVDRIGWEIDRYDLTPDRLVIEVLETVVANRTEDVVIRNLSGLARLGCCLDLDDFGTGHASITSIRRFSIERIKIDRSFVTHIDEDPEQQKMVAAILTMAERLGLDTLAEGVETAEERAMLTQLGCGHLQGFGIARPMPLAETESWIRAHQCRRAENVPFHLRVV